MNQLDTNSRARIVAGLVEGNSIRATCRMTDAAKGTVLKLLADIGAACAAFQDSALRDLPCKRLQCDEIWAFCYAKDKNLPDSKRGQPGVGSVWTWTAIDADTKLMVGFRVGTRDAECAQAFLDDVAWRLRSRVQLTSDGHRAYLDAVPQAFGNDVDFGTLVKLYGRTREEAVRYSPPRCVGVSRGKIRGNPDQGHISTSFVERSNLTMRMSMRRFTRLTNAFSKKVENLEHAVALHFMHYNFCRVHQTLKTTPAMAAGVADRVWSIEDLVGLLGQAKKAA